MSKEEEQVDRVKSHERNVGRAVRVAKFDQFKRWLPHKPSKTGGLGGVATGLITVGVAAGCAEVQVQAQAPVGAVEFELTKTPTRTFRKPTRRPSASPTKTPTPKLTATEVPATDIPPKATKKAVPAKTPTPEPTATKVPVVEAPAAGGREVYVKCAKCDMAVVDKNWEHQGKPGPSEPQVPEVKQLAEQLWPPGTVGDGRVILEAENDSGIDGGSSPMVSVRLIEPYIVGKYPNDDREAAFWKVDVGGGKIGHVELPLNTGSNPEAWQDEGIGPENVGFAKVGTTFGPNVTDLQQPKRWNHGFTTKGLAEAQGEVVLLSLTNSTAIPDFVSGRENYMVTATIVVLFHQK